ncbi:GmrSD restriction endonuclease domain-containing protein [Micromonospora sp. LOL_023]|uniref:GmrSD restriction endonuclease domain-containing protein n=1 Tax=Micromonospora sp. LOL_023 TaxID=3345418 RepID=UPI003A861076
MVAAQETTLQKLLEGTKQYRVPLYQRTYSWSEQQCKRLWEDIEKLADDRRADPAATHFIGSVVLAPSPEIGPVGVQEFLVVDGQQRLTTLSILLCAIRDHRAETEDPKHRGRIEQLYLINQFESDPHRLKLVPTQADRGAYLACVESTPQVGGRDHVGSAYDFFVSRLREYDDVGNTLDIARIENAVITGLALVAVTAQAGDNVYRIFESLNNTGLQLTQADLLRNYLFMRLPTRGETVYESLWFPLQDALDRNDRDRRNLELLFWLDLVQRDGRAKQTDIYAAHQKRLNAMRGEAEIEAEVRRFSRLGALLKIILHPESEPDLEVRRRLTRLHAWGATTVYPLLLHLLDRRAQGTATAGQIIAAMRYVESFFVRRLVIGRATANLNRILMSIVTEMDPKLPVDEAVRAYLSTGRKHYATDAQVRSLTRTIPFFLNGRAHQRNLVLQWLEEAHRSKEPVAADSLSIEHVLPQTPTAQWRQMLNDDLGPDENFTDLHESLVHTIGNLTLTGYNSELGNKPFDAKKAALARSPIVLNRDIARQERWGRPEIQARSEALAEQIISLWPGPAETSRDHDSDVPWDVMNRALAELPAGSWTTYGDVAALIGSHPVPVGTRLANHPAPNAHRVLQTGGTFSPSFRWPDPASTDDPLDLLRAEGVEFDGSGRAAPEQRIPLDELAQLAGLSTDDLPRPRSPRTSAAHAGRFSTQVAQLQDPPVVAAVQAVLDGWTALGGNLLYGTGDEASCFLIARGKDHRLGNIWPAAIYPSGKFEIVFQHFKNRVPFDDMALRAEFRQRLNKIPGVNIAAARIGLRPGFRLPVLADPAARELLIEQLDWFYQQAQPPAEYDADAGDQLS